MSQIVMAWVVWFGNLKWRTTSSDASLSFLTRMNCNECLIFCRCGSRHCVDLRLIFRRWTWSKSTSKQHDKNAKLSKRNLIDLWPICLKLLAFRHYISAQFLSCCWIKTNVIDVLRLIKQTQFQSVYVFFKQFYVLPKCSEKFEKPIVSCKVL